MKNTLLLLLACAPTLLLACDGEGDGGSGATGSCALVGAPLDFEDSQSFDLGATADGFVFVLADGQGVGAWTLTMDSLGAREVTPIPAQGQVELAADGERLHAISYGSGWALHGLPVATRQADGSWTSVSYGDTLFFGLGPKAASLLSEVPGEVELLWTGTYWEDSKSYVALTAARCDGATVDATSTPLADLDGLDGRELHVARAADGTTHLMTMAQVDGVLSVVHAARPASGTWSSAATVGPAPGSSANTVVTALAASSAGPVWAAEVRDAELFDDTGGLTAYRLDGGAVQKVGAVSDYRPVIQGVAAAALDDGRLLVTASWGENNLDQAQSDDEVVLYACAPSGGCRQAVVVDGRRGTSFGPTKLAVRGTDGIAAWQWEAKGDGAAGVTVQRFSCDP